jgi:uncharacterized membrane protein
MSNTQTLQKPLQVSQARSNRGNMARASASAPKARHARDVNEQRLARGLGWFSIGLGLSELLFPKQLGRAIGVGEHTTLLRLLGLRELGSGVALLAEQRPSSNWLRTRVAGDAMDLTLLGLALTSPRSQKGKLLMAGVAVAGVTALDMLSVQQRSRREGLRADGSIELSVGIAVNRPADELYRFWRQLDNLPRVLSHVRVVRSEGARSRWIVNGPAGMQLEWTSEITEDSAPTRLAWRSVDGAPLRAQGAVEFAALPAGRGTLVRVTLVYAPGAGALASSLAHTLKPLTAAQLGQDLRRFKQLMEAGEIATTRGQPTGRRSAISRDLP